MNSPINKPLLSYLSLDYKLMNDIQFIRFENLQTDFDLLCNTVGIPRVDLPRKNDGNYRHYTEYYDNTTQELVAQKYAKDIEYFGYTFGE
jgi:hypothetical protein